MRTIKIAMYERVHPTEIEDDNDRERWERKLADRAREVRWRLQLMYRGRAIIDLREFILVTTSSITPGNLFGSVTRGNFINNGGTNGWIPEISHVVGGTSGAASIGGAARGSASMALRHTDFTVSWHEIGHNLGAPHSKDYETKKEYGGIDFMADDDARPDVLTSLQLDLVDESKSLEINGESVECILAPLETLPEDMLEGTYSYLKVLDPETEDMFYVSRRAGESYIPPSSFQTHVITIHPSTRAWNSYYYGRNESINGNYQFELVETQNGYSKIRATYKGQTATPVNFPRRFPNVDTSKLNSNISGMWFDPMFNGQGFGIHYLEGRNEILLFWYTHSNNTRGESNRRWYMAQGTIDESNYFEMKVYSSVQGRTLIDAGHCSLSIDGDVGKFRYMNQNGSRLDYNIQRLTPECEDSVWFDPTLEKEGFQVFNWDDRIVSLWYGYGPRRIGSIFNPSDPTSAQRWWMYEGTLIGNDEYEGIVYEAENGILFHPKEVDMKIKTENAIMKFSNNTMTFSEYPEKTFIPLI